MFQPLPVFVGLRYSLAREHSFFVSFITWVSLLGVALGVAALITVLSVMNGFESELRGRLLSLSAHATLSSGGAPISRLEGPLKPVAGFARLDRRSAASSIRDAMLSNQSSMSGAIVRGIDPKLEPQVSSIGEAMREGKLTDLLPGIEPHRSGTDAGLPAAGGGGRYGRGDDPRQFRVERRRASRRACRNSRSWAFSRWACRSTTAFWR